MTPRYSHLLLSCFIAGCLQNALFAETGDYLEEDPYTDKAPQAVEPAPSSPRPSTNARPAQPSTTSRVRSDKRKYFTDDAPRSDAGVFHVGFAAGGNFYIEPVVNATTQAPTGNYFKDFGFQAGVYFDHDYSELDENIPLMLRGMVGYKYILSSIHVFSFDGMVRRMFRLSERASFGLGVGASGAIWYRTQTASSPNEEIIFLPTVLIGGGFEFNPFMVDLKWAINRIGGSNSIMGFELYFGFRL